MRRASGERQQRRTIGWADATCRYVSSHFQVGQCHAAAICHEGLSGPHYEPFLTVSAYQVKIRQQSVSIITRLGEQPFTPLMQFFVKCSDLAASCGQVVVARQVCVFLESQ